MWLLAGPNGAGKSTYAENLEGRVAEIVRPDELAYRISQEAPEAAALTAGRSAVRLLQEFIDRRASGLLPDAHQFISRVLVHFPPQGAESVSPF
jgi:predicted ABC-type ATPase